MLQVHSSSTTWICFDGMGPCNKIQHSQSAARFCYSEYLRTSSFTSMLQELGWEDLQSRRKQNKVAMMYRIVNNLVEIPADQYLTAAGVSTRGHQQRFLVQYPSTLTRDPFSRLQSISGIVCPPVPYQHQIWMTSRSSSVLVSQDRNCELYAFNWF